MPGPRLLPQTPAGWALTALGALTAAGTGWLLWPATARERIARAALSQVGQTDASRYWADVLPGTPPSGYPKDWCGAFALWAWHQAGVDLPQSWIIGYGFLSGLPTTTDPQVGDVAYFDKYEHQAVVVGVNGGAISLVNGNGTAGAVSTSTIDKSQAAAFYSVEPLLSMAESDNALPWVAASAVVIGAGAWVLLPGGTRSKDDPW